MTRPWHAPLRGWIAPLLAALALPVGAVFVCSCHAQTALPVLAWQASTLLLLLGAVLSPRYRAHPGVPAGLAGVIVWGTMAPLVFAGLQGPSFTTVLAWFGGGLAASILAASVAERPATMGSTTLPGGGLRGSAAVLALASLGWLGWLAARAPGPEVVEGTVLARVEIPALPTLMREEISGPSGLELRVASEPAPGGGATARVSLARMPTELSQLGGVPTGTSEACVVPVAPLGQTVEVVARPGTLTLRWPISPHGESFGSCTYEHPSLRRLYDAAPRHAPGELSWSLGGTAFFALLVLGLGARVRRRYARAARSPEVRVQSPGLATLPDGSLATLGEDVPMGTSVVALRIADRRPDYRSDARVSIEEHLAGEKNAILADLSRRVRTLELFALAGVVFLASVALGAAISGTILLV